MTVRYHDHTRLFRLPATLRRALQDRIARLNEAVDDISRLANVLVIDLATLPVDDASMWSIDRLHPSEVGHRHLARAVADGLETSGFAVRRPVGVGRSGGAPVTQTDRAWWMFRQGVPWLVRRSADLVPFLVLVAIARARSLTRSAVTRRV